MLCGARWIGAVFVATVATVVSAAGDATRFHADAPAVEKALTESVRALMVHDLPAARKAMDRLEELCRRMSYEERKPWGESIVNADRSYHMALTRSREFAGAGEGDLAFEGIVGVQQVCRVCHGFAKTQGVWPPKPATGGETAGR